MTSAAPSWRAGLSMRTTLVVAAGSLIALIALAPLAFSPHAFESIDTAIKVIQANELSRSGYRSMALSYPAGALDPAEHFLPFEDPFVFLAAGKWQSIFSSFYALLAAPLVPHGVHWLVALSMLGVVVAVTSASRLAGAHPLAGPIALLATPIWLYGVLPSETSLALGCALSAMAVAMRVGDPRGDWVAGLLLGTAALLRDESLLLAPGLLFARHLAGTPVRRLPRAIVAIGVPILAMSVLDHWWLERPMLAHLRHAVPGFDALLPRSRARLPELAVMRWHERLTTVVEYWLLGFGGLATSVALTVWVALAHRMRRLTPVLVAALVATAAVLHVVDVAMLVPAPRIMAGLLRLAPFLLLALLPRGDGAPTSPLVRVAWISAGGYLAIVLVTINTAGGKPTGPRLTIALWPLLAAAAVETLSSYASAARRAWTARVTAVCGAVLVAGSLVMEMAVIRPARAGRTAEDAEAARVVHAIGDDVIVMDTMFEIQLVGPLYFDRKVVLGRRRQWKELSRTLAEHDVARFTHVARFPADAPRFPHYRRADVWEPGRFIISRWVRETSTSP